ncbi:hypothetical protein [Microbacterium laevaniformans]|uniref:hypothetical protein n=1 Tax=Microbacterium laevaniformans TaxID=36807 RepID=UPI0031E83C1B
MRVRLDEVQKGRRGEALGTTSLTYRSGRATLAVAETEQRPTVLGLIASGACARMPAPSHSTTPPIAAPATRCAVVSP